MAKRQRTTTKKKPKKTTAAKPKKKATRTKSKSVTKKSTSAKSQFPRHRQNPFREGSAYGKGFDILVAHKNGMHRHKFVELLANESGKDVKRASYDAAVVLSAGPESRHRSCRDGFHVEKKGLHITLIVD